MSNDKPKDNWDKFDIWSKATIAFMTAILTLFGYQFTVNAKKFDDKMALLQTIEKWLPVLVSEDEKMKDAAIMAIKELGDPSLALILGKVYKAGEAVKKINLDSGVSAMRKIETITVQSAIKNRAGWIYLGEYDENNWVTQYIDFDKKSLPAELSGKVNYKVAADQLNVRKNMPNKLGVFGDINEAIGKDTEVNIIEVRDWLSTGYIWARINY